MQRNIWILSIKTSLPEYCRGAGSLRTSIFAFDTFAEARAALRKALKHYAYSKNNLFDGCGYLNNYGNTFGMILLMIRWKTRGMSARKNPDICTSGICFIACLTAKMSPRNLSGSGITARSSSPMMMGSSACTETKGTRFGELYRPSRPICFPWRRNRTIIFISTNSSARIIPRICI